MGNACKKPGPPDSVAVTLTTNAATPLAGTPTSAGTWTRTRSPIAGRCGTQPAGTGARLLGSSVEHARGFDGDEATRRRCRRTRVDRREVTHRVDDDVAAGGDEDRDRTLPERDDGEVRPDLVRRGDVHGRETTDRSAEGRQRLDVELADRLGRGDVDGDRRRVRWNDAGGTIGRSMIEYCGYGPTRFAGPMKVDGRVSSRRTGDGSAVNALGCE